MALPYGPVDEAIARMMLHGWRNGKPISDSWLYNMVERDRNQYVRYDATLNRVVLEEPNTFYDLCAGSPSDSRMMVPK